MKPRWKGRLHLFLHHVLDDLRAGKMVSEIAEEYGCTRAWIYLMLKESGLDIADFRWYRNSKSYNLSPTTRQIASLLASKALKVRTTGRVGLLWVLDGDRPPIKLIVHTIHKPHRTNPAAKVRYFQIQTRRKGGVHVTVVDRRVLAIKSSAPTSGVNIPESLDNWQPKMHHTVQLADLADIEILDVLRANVR